MCVCICVCIYIFILYSALCVCMYMCVVYGSIHTHTYECGATNLGGVVYMYLSKARNYRMRSLTNECTDTNLGGVFKQHVSVGDEHQKLVQGRRPGATRMCSLAIECVLLL